MSEPLVSIIVPVYNAEQYLALCLSSILRQSYSILEVIVVDDGSTDASSSIVEAFCHIDSRVRLIRQNHSGQSVARNYGIEQAKGEYLMFVDADDTIDPDFVAQHLAYSEGNDLVQSGYRRVRTDGYIILERLPRYKYRLPSPCLRLYRRSFLMDKQLRFPIGMIYEDIIFSLRLWNSAPRVKIIPYVGYNYLINPTSTTSHPRYKARWNLYRQIFITPAPIGLKLLTFIRLFFHFLIQ